ncbi:MAG: sensor histidine kinase [Bryobacteraceae bacterium]
MNLKWPQSRNSGTLYLLPVPNLHQVATLSARSADDRFARRSAFYRYAVPVIGMSAATVIGLALRQIHAGHSASTIAYLVAALASAWWGGYGPGVLACLLGLLGAPYFFSPGFSILHLDVPRAALVLLVSILISRVAEGRRRAEDALWEANEQLDARVRERTEELQKSNAELRHLNEALEEFSYSASHDLQQPLRMITLYAQLLERNYRGRLSSEANEYVAAIVSGARQMKLLLEDLLAYSRSVHTSTENIGIVDANEVLSKVLVSLKGSLEESQAKIDSSRLPNIRMHDFHLTELFQNLISNAIKYRSNERPLIDIRAHGDEGPFWIFSIADNGIGIAAEHAKQIFGLFKRLHGSDSYEGTGVGLAICERVVERYGGTIWVEPRSPRGSTFYFKLPTNSEDIRTHGIQASSSEPALNGGAL